jgi:hypothetical protein
LKTGIFKSFFPSTAEGSAMGKLLGISSLGGFLVKTAAGIVTGAAKIALTGEGSLKIAVGSAYAGGSVSYTRTIDGNNQYTAQGQLSTPIPGTSVAASVQHSSNKDGTTSNKVSTTEASPFAQKNQQSKTDYDASGKEIKTTETESTTAGVPLVESGAVYSDQEKVVTTPEGSERSGGEAGGIGAPFGSKQLWGAPL